MSKVGRVFAVLLRGRSLVAIGLLAAVGLLAYRHFANSGPAYQVKDIVASGASAPQELTDVDGRLFFSADDDRHGRELWISDGTTVGTTMVKDIHPGAEGWATMTPVGVAGTAFFVADDGDHGYELWKSDGSANGTVIVKDIHPGLEGSGPGYLVETGGSLLFVADDGTHGDELWTSDGTAAGTMMVEDIWQGTNRGSRPERRRRAFLARPLNLTDVAGRAFFSADDGNHGRELWTSDGTAAGTVQVRDVRPGPLGSNPEALIDVVGTLFFTANDGIHGRELWTSDGTTGGTTLVRDADRESAEGPQMLVDVAGTAFFTLRRGVEGDQLWRSDGTTSGTALVAVVNTGAADSSVRSLTDVGGTLFFTAVGEDAHAQLWRSDGTAAGTLLVTDLPGGPQAGPPEWLTEAAGILYFVARENDSGPWDAELWRSDGTAAGTFQVQDIQRGEHSSAPSWLTLVGETLFFATGNDDGELWALPIGPESSLNV